MEKDFEPIIEKKEEIFKEVSNYSETQNLKKNAFEFIIGLITFSIGLFLVFQNTILYTSFTLMDLLGFTPPFGVILLPLIIGVGILFFNEKSVIGWILTIVGLVTIVLGIIMGLKIFFKPVTLYQGLLMFCSITAGIGLMAKGLLGKK